MYNGKGLLSVIEFEKQKYMTKEQIRAKAQDYKKEMIHSGSAETDAENGFIAGAMFVQQLLQQTQVSGSLPIEEVALHAADDWFDTAQFRSDVKADLISYYEGYRDAMQFCQSNDR